MFILRLEHDRDACTDEKYMTGGRSPIGHGPASGCYATRPNFGHQGSPPSGGMAEYERCAVTADQFNDWIGYAYNAPDCYNSTAFCRDDGYPCSYCPCLKEKTLAKPDDWHIMAYWVEDWREGLDWRIDSHQVIFNPGFATQIGPVELWEVEQMSGEKVFA